MTVLPITSSEEAANLRKFPCLAIDLGFAQSAKSCGLSSQTNGVTYSEAIQKTLEWIRELPSGSGVVILEAPLSASFAENGNPTPRGNFEIQHSVSGATDRRVWQSGPGASTALAAVHFLRTLLRNGENCGSTIHLLEGFCSRYGGTKAEKPNDVEVAKELVRLWQNDTVLIRPEGTFQLSTLHLVDSAASETPPAILQVPDGFTASTNH